ncbi:MAG: putative bifunctional diguanylate cyclase/phosphodiesterase [Thiohalomonadaceae bacterium]
MPLPKTIKGFIILASAGVSLVMFSTLYGAITRVYDNAVRQSAAEVSETLAQGTFNAMFQVMRQGWTRPQMEEFIASVQHASAGAPYSIDIYRGERVTELFGPIAQKPIEGAVQQTFKDATPVTTDAGGILLHAFPLVARDECLRCHVNASAGEVLGVIEVRQDVGALADQARNNLLFTLLAVSPIPILAALLAVWFFQRKLDASIGFLQQNIETINKVSDLRNIEHRDLDLGFAEFNSIFSTVAELADKLRSVAVDKDLLEFEIRLLEKFVITSEVVRDWREYVGYLLGDINQIIEAYALFSIFKVDDELFDLEVFWVRPPEENTRRMMEEAVLQALRSHPAFGGLAALEFHHHVTGPGEPITLTREQLDLQTKSLIVETPKIGGIVGIGVQADLLKDQTRMLVTESILSTLLNVVGSVKAIYKYTRDLEYYATRDPLTNIYNQRLFWELLGYEIKRAERHGYSFALLVIDLDNFKSINDTYGHAFGDRFLMEFALAVQRVLRPGDIFARYGGDEFVLILPEAAITLAKTLSERVLESAAQMTLEAPDGSRVKATISIGVALFPDHATDVKDLFLFADNMMYKAKSDGKNRIGLPTDEDVVEIFRNIGEKSLIISNAIEERRIVPYFQPIVGQDGEVAAIEVLSRIQLPDGLLGAHEFIEITEKLGLIHKLDAIVMEKTFEQVVEHGYPGLIFLNLSPRALVMGEFIKLIKDMTHRFGITPQRVVFEITERDTVKNLGLLEKFVNELNTEGFGLAIDDFGSGFSSFHYLKRFPIDFVKIEGDFVVNMASDQRDAAFVKSIAALAQELGIRSIAEFVETEEVLECVRRAGIDFAQGFHVGRPSPDLVQAASLQRGKQAG